MSVNGGGGANPLSATFEKYIFFSLKKEKDADYSETEKYVFC